MELSRLRTELGKLRMSIAAFGGSLAVRYIYITVTLITILYKNHGLPVSK
jgi:hypothetical protein